MTIKINSDRMRLIDDSGRHINSGGSRNLSEIMKIMGYSELYPPQELALSKGVAEGKNLLIVTPTASGKTLTAMLAAISVLERGLKVVYLTPLRALASEKYHDFKLFEKHHLVGKQIKVRIASGDYTSPGSRLSDADIIVATNEKMDSLLRRRIDWLQKVGVFITDEFHLLSDPERGPTLEMLLTKIRSRYSKAQILALSATVANSSELAEWLDCDLVLSSWRPTKLVEGIFEDGRSIMNDGSRFTVNVSTETSASVDVAIDCVAKGGQSLIFAETRKRCVSLAARAADTVYQMLSRKEALMAAEESSKLLKKGDDTDLTMTLVKLVKKGVAFHHAGLSHQCRDLVETAYTKGVVKLIVATPTLASGVNLPARRVILSSVMRYDLEQGGYVPIRIMEYKQLCGRAGRPQYDEKGEGIIIANDNISGEDLYDHYINGTPEPIRSNLMNGKSLRSHVLSTVAEVPGIRRSEIHSLFANTLCAYYHDKSMILAKVDEMLYYLEEQELIKSKNDRYIATSFGKTISLLYMDPFTGVQFRNFIGKVMRNGNDSQDNHILAYLQVVTSSEDFFPKLQLRKKDLEFVLDLLSKNESRLVIPLDEHACTRSLLVLHNWIEEASVRQISLELGVEPGDLYRIAEAGERLVSCLYEIAKLCGRDDLLLEIDMLRRRVKYGAKSELLSMLRLTGIGRVKARSLFDAGVTSTKDLIEMDEKYIARIPKIGTTMARKIKKETIKFM
ncbi:MAG: DEAD/DEAH box helicase [Nitrososphaeraceae archaeon]